MAIREFVDQDFINEFRLFVVGKRINPQRNVWEYYIKSRRAADYKQELTDSLYHPPHIVVDRNETEKDEVLHLIHSFEGKELVREYIQNTMLGIEYLWGSKVVLETHEVDENEIRRANSEEPQSAELNPVPVLCAFNASSTPWRIEN